MAESLLPYTVEKITGKIIFLAAQELWLAWGLEKDLKSLETSLSSIKAVILDAQEQRTTNHKLSLWLRHLKHVLYDAEDVLDDFAYQVLRNQVLRAQGSIIRKVLRFSTTTSNPMVYRLRIGHRIKCIRRCLDKIDANKNEFNLASNLQAETGHAGRFREREMTHSFVNESDIIGRNGDKKVIVKFLMDSHGYGENVSVIPIVGIGGLGKTALAKLVFNDKRVVGHFGPRVWVCLGDMKEFSINQVMENIVKSLTREKTVDTSNPEHLQIVIQNILQNRRFLLILDDMWDANRSSWLEFKALLGCGREGSKIVVTTRINSVASCVGTISPYNLKGLPHNKCVLLFKKLAFASEEEVDQQLMIIGAEIVRKCKCVPLAVISLANLLFLHSEKDKWLSVKDSRIWQIVETQNDILPVLRFSYDLLSSQLKQCFVYCSIFPEDYEFSDVSLISFWMAHGLLQSRNSEEGGQEVFTLQPEFVGKQYIKELLSRGFFQDFCENSYSWSFKMHDLVREFACSLGEEEFAVIKVQDKNIGENVRHGWFEVQEFYADLSNAVQSVLVPEHGFWGTIRFAKACITKFKHLKVLCLANSEFEELPNSIGALKHLRSLDLSRCRRLKKLPNSLYKLHNLQTLVLLWCTQLLLPSRIGELVHLRRLEITTLQKHLSDMNGLECLAALQILHFTCPLLEVVFEGTRVHLLTSLRTLILHECYSLYSLFQLSTGINYSLPALETLYIGYCANLDLNLMDQQHDDAAIVSQYFQMPRLRKLIFEGLPQLEDADSWPQWIQGCANTLEYLEIKRCENITVLPEWLPNLTSLRTLKLHSCSVLGSFPKGMERLVALKELEIVACQELSERCDRKRGGEDWLKIAHVPSISLLREARRC